VNQPYESQTVLGWTQAGCQIDVIPDQKAPELLLLSGICPGCEHQTVHEEPLYMVYSQRSPQANEIPVTRSLLRRRRVPPGFQRNIVVVCCCESLHEGAPSTETGCGAAWQVEVSWGRK
jgi:hypothetical protein